MSCLHWLTSKSLFIFREIYVFQSLCILLNATLCRVCPLKPLFLHTLLWFTYIAALKLKALSLSLTPFIPRSLSCFLSPHHVFFSTLLFLPSVILFISLTLPSLLTSSVGRLLIEFSSQMTMERVQKENPNVTEGGRYTPPDCQPRWKVCICVSSSGAEMGIFFFFLTILDRVHSHIVRLLKRYMQKRLQNNDIFMFLYQNRSKSSHVTFLSN